MEFQDLKDQDQQLVREALNEFFKASKWEKEVVNEVRQNSSKIQDLPILASTHVIEYFCQHKSLTLKKVLKIFHLAPSTYYHQQHNVSLQKKEIEDLKLTVEILKILKEHPKIPLRRVHFLISERGFDYSLKKVHRIYQKKGGNRRRKTESLKTKSASKRKVGSIHHRRRKS